MLKDKLKFVICSSHRTGSEMLRHSIRQHPRLKVAGEIFIFKEGRVEFRDDPNEMLDQIFQHFNGFKLHRWVELPTSYKHEKFTYSRCLKAWGAIATRPNIKVIDLKRRNLLALLVSYEIAKRTRIWLIGRGHRAISKAHNDKIQKPVIRFEPEELANMFSKKEHEYQMASTLLGGHERIEIYYEDMVVNSTEIFTNVQTFLEVPVRSLKVTTHKQEKRPLSEAIQNFDELKEFFRDTKYHDYFV